MHSAISPKQKRVLDELRRFMQSQGYMPTVRELEARLTSSVSTIHQHLKALEAKGRIVTDGSPRGIVLVMRAERDTISIATRLAGEVHNGKAVRFPSPVASGAYFVTMNAGDFEQKRKLTLLK